MALATDAVMTGKAFTVTVTNDVSLQLPSVPMTIYVDVWLGEATTVLPVFVFNPAEGLQLKEPAPLAVILTLCPEQISAGVLVVTFSALLTLTVTLLVAVQPFWAVPTTV